MLNYSPSGGQNGNCSHSCRLVVVDLVGITGVASPKLCWCWADVQRSLKVLELLWGVHRDLWNRKKCKLIMCQNKPFFSVKPGYHRYLKWKQPNQTGQWSRRIRVLTAFAIFIYSQTVKLWEKGLMKTKYKPQTTEYCLYISSELFCCFHCYSSSIHWSMN